MDNIIPKLDTNGNPVKNSMGRFVGVKAGSRGVMQPTLFLDTDYLYIYYIDSGGYDYANPQLDDLDAFQEVGMNINNLPSWFNGVGRQGGVKVARAPIEDALNPLAYNVLFNGAFDQPALPADFEKENRHFLTEKGPKGDTLFSDSGWYYCHGPMTGWVSKNPEVNQFSVVEIEGENYYLGVEESFGVLFRPSFPDLSVVATFIRFSTDLISWSPPTLIHVTEPWTANSDLLYTRVYSVSDRHNIDGRDNNIIGTEVVSGNTYAVFYLVGTRCAHGDCTGSGGIGYRKFYVLIP